MLPVELTKQGHTLKQVCRTNKTAIYENWKHGRIQVWDAIRIQVAPEHTFPNGSHYPERETFPTSEEWGTYGFSCLTLESAHRRVEQLRKMGKN